MGFIDAIHISRDEALRGRSIAERRLAINAEVMPQLSKRLAMKVIDEIIFSYTHLENAHEIRKMQRAGIEHVGWGAESIVLRVGEQALKCVRGSHDWDEATRQQLVAEKANDFAHVTDHLGRFVLDQLITVDTHPYYDERRVVQTIQPFVKTRPAVLRHAVGDDVTITSEAPLDQLSNFIDAAHRLHHETQLLPDTNGINNIVALNNELILLDTQPVGVQHAGVQEVILAQLDSMSRQLDELNKSAA